jgi:hypothetical protein
MKKIFLILIFLGFANYANAYACFCTPFIFKAFQDLSNEVNIDIGAQSTAVSSLIKQIEKNMKDIEEQNKVIEKIIEGEKRKALQNTEIVFLLKKIIELKTAGEM